jgi:hypothetical protein
MLAVSAADAVSPAVQRTRNFLFRPFNWGTYLKLGLIAMITEGFGSNFQSSSHNGPSSGHGLAYAPFDIAPLPIAAVAAAVVGAFLLAMVIFYLITRLRFAFFHCLTYNIKEIWPGWQLYRTQAMRFFWLNLAVGFFFVITVALLSLPFIGGFQRLFHESEQGGHLDVGLLLALVLPLIPVLALVVLAAILADIVLRDWMLPHFALENATAGEAWSRVLTSIRAEKRQFFVYALLRVILPAIAMVALFMALIIPGLILAGAAAAFGYGLHSAFAGASGSSAVVGVLIQVFFGVLGFAFMLLAAICLGGPVSTAVREYALMFYGGRYRALGDALDHFAAKA